MKTIKSTKTQVVATITAADIRERFNLPQSAAVTFRVPSGGDYSGMTLELDNAEQVIKVGWEESK